MTDSMAMEQTQDPEYIAQLKGELAEMRRCFDVVSRQHRQSLMARRRALLAELSEIEDSLGLPRSIEPRHKR